jgi:Ca-activated chloride channel family protein
VQRVIQQNMGRVRFCYEDGLRKNPSLSGRVTTRFLIRRDGIVGAVQTTESTLGDRGVEDCVARVFGSLSFPPPEHSTVTVVYPIMMSPAEPERATPMSFSE